MVPFSGTTATVKPMSPSLQVFQTALTPDGVAHDSVGDETFLTTFRDGRLDVTGLCTASIEASWPIPLGRVKRGIAARVECAGEVRIHRPRFGFHRSSRTIYIVGEGISWHTDYRGSRRYSIVKDSGAVILEQTKSQILIEANLSPCEVALLVAVLRSEVIDTSSLLSYVTL